MLWHRTERVEASKLLCIHIFATHTLSPTQILLLCEVIDEYLLQHRVCLLLPKRLASLSTVSSIAPTFSLSCPESASNSFLATSLYSQRQLSEYFTIKHENSNEHMSFIPWMSQRILCPTQSASSHSLTPTAYSVASRLWASLVSILGALRREREMRVCDRLSGRVWHVRGTWSMRCVLLGCSMRT